MTLTPLPNQLINDTSGKNTPKASSRVHLSQTGTSLDWKDGVPRTSPDLLLLKLIFVKSFDVFVNISNNVRFVYNRTYQIKKHIFQLDVFDYTQSAIRTGKRFWAFNSFLMRSFSCAEKRECPQRMPIKFRFNCLFFSACLLKNYIGFCSSSRARFCFCFVTPLRTSWSSYFAHMEQFFPQRLYCSSSNV